MSSAKPIVVITRTRSGSNLLCDYLGQVPGVVSLGEILKPTAPQRMSRVADRLALHPPDLVRLDRLQETDRGGFWHCVRDACARRGLVPAAKMFYGGAPPDDALWSALADARILHLIRENVLATVVSRKLAQRVRAWRGSKGGAYDTEPIMVPRDDCDAHLEKLRGHVLWTRARFSDGDYREIAYDTVCDPAASSDALSRALGARVTLTQRLERQRNRPLGDVVVNYRDVAEFDRNFPLIEEGFAA